MLTAALAFGPRALGVVGLIANGERKQRQPNQPDNRDQSDLTFAGRSDSLEIRMCDRLSPSSEMDVDVIAQRQVGAIRPAGAPAGNDLCRIRSLAATGARLERANDALGLDKANDRERTGSPAGGEVGIHVLGSTRAFRLSG